MPDGATRIARLDLNPGAPHVQEQGPHLNWSKPLIPVLGWLVMRRCGSGLGGLGWGCGARG
jgi:hypothetical protein